MQVNTKATDSAITDSIVTSLAKAYPKALSYADMFEKALNGVPASSKLNKQGGTYLRTLVKQGRVKQIARGYYSLIPQ